MSLRRTAHIKFWRNPDLRILFALTVLVPGLLLSVTGARAYLQERRYSRQEAREQLERIAETTAREVAATLTEWIRGMSRLDPSHPRLDDLGTAFRAALHGPGGAVIVITRGEQHRIWPEAQLLYRPANVTGRSSDAMTLPVAFAAAELLEVRDHDYTRALAGYRTLLATAAPAARSLLTHRVARVLRKAGEQTEADRLMRELATADDAWVGDVPAGLVAAFEMRVPTTYADLVAGRWLLDRTRFTFYEEASARWTDQAAREALQSRSAEKRRLTEAVESLIAGSPPRTHLVLSSTSEKGSATALVSHDWLRQHAWPNVLAAAMARGLNVVLTAPSGQIAFQTTASPVGVAGLAASVDLVGDGTGWRIRVAPADPRAFTARFERQRMVYLVILVLVVGLLGFGSYVTFRLVRRELEIAQLQSDFVATVSHEFRSPLTAIRQLTEMLARGRVHDEARKREYYERITREGDRLSRLVDNLLDFSRMESGKKEYEFQSVEPTSWLRGLVADARAHYAPRGIVISTDIPDGLPQIVGDPVALACAVDNLLDNAAKYSPGRDTVWISARASAHHLTIMVRDEGVGISDADRERIFNKFYRSSAPITQQVKGAGLGLSLVQRIMDAHGGSIACESSLGAGSTFMMNLKAGV